MKKQLEVFKGEMDPGLKPMLQWVVKKCYGFSSSMLDKESGAIFYFPLCSVGVCLSSGQLSGPLLASAHGHKVNGIYRKGS